MFLKLGAAPRHGIPSGREPMMARLSYAADEVGLGAGIDPRLRYTFEMREWSVSLGYISPLGD